MLNTESKIPLYHQLAEILLSRIRSGEYPVGSKVPSENSLAEIYGIGRPTARQATDLLVRRHILVRKRGSGTFVKGEPREVDLFSLAGTLSSFQHKGIPIRIRILKKTKLITTSKDQENPFSEQKAYFLSRISQLKKIPVLIEHIYLHPSLFAGIDMFDLSTQSLSKVVKNHYFMIPKSGNQNFRIGYLNGKMAKELKVTQRTPILVVKRFLHFNQVKNAIFAELFCRTDQLLFSQQIGGIQDEQPRLL